MDSNALLRHSRRGFTLVELLIILALVGIIGLLGYPALTNAIHRSRVDGTTRQVATMVRGARLEAVKTSRATGVYVDTTPHRALVFVDADANDAFDDPADGGADEILGEPYLLPTVVRWGGPGGSAAVVDFDTDSDGGWVLFGSDGAASDSGAFRLGDRRGNFLEIEVSPRATGRVDLRKYDPSRTDPDGEHWFAQGQDGKSWEWN